MTASVARGPLAGLLPESGHGRAVLGMVGATLLWSTAGVVTRHLHQQDGWLLVFWRSGFAALGVAAWMLWRHGAAATMSQLRRASPMLWVSALCWAVMFTAFMIALTLTSVAQTLVADSLSPLVAALLGWAALRHPLPRRTWIAIAVATAGMFAMVLHDVRFGGETGTQLAGLLVACLVPLAAATNWVSLRHAGAHVPMQPAVFIGAGLSALFAAAWAWLPAVDLHDLFWLAMLGVFQLAVPGLLAVWAAQRLAPAEVGLLGLLETVFGILWAWAGAGERPAAWTLGGGLLILGALAGNEWLGWRRRRA